MRSILVVTYGVAAFLLGCHDAAENTKETEKAPVNTTVIQHTVQLSAEQIRNAGITIGAAKKMNMHTTLKVNGVVDVPPQNIISVSFPMGGYLKQMRLLPGMQISKGQVLAVLEDPQYIQLQQDYLVAKSKLHFLEADFARQKELNESKANSDKVFQQVKSDYESQQVMVWALGEKLHLININAAQLNADNITRQVNIYAPISGYITKVNVNTGKYVAPADILFELINPADLHLSLTVFEKDLLYLTPGQKVTCYNNRSGERYTASVHLINRNIDESRSAEIHCHFDKYDKSLLPGMFMNAEIALNNAAATAVPDEAVVRWENKYYVFVADSTDRFTMTQVETGSHTDGYTEIRTDLKSPDIVVKNAYALLMKLKNSAEEG